MGYTTEFEGKFKLSKPLNENQRKYLVKLNETRRMARNVKILETLINKKELSNYINKSVGLPLGKEGEYFVGGVGPFGQDFDKSVYLHNDSPGSQPSLWCQWVPDDKGEHIQWDQGEKFYDYIDWIKYIQNNILSKWKLKLNGTIFWQGEENDDVGVIHAENGKIQAYSKTNKQQWAKIKAEKTQTKINKEISNSSHNNKLSKPKIM